MRDFNFMDMGVYARAYYDGRVKGCEDNEYVAALEEDQDSRYLYKRGYEHGVADFVRFDEVMS